MSRPSRPLPEVSASAASASPTQPADPLQSPALTRSVWRGNQIGHGTVAALGSGHPKLDAELPGGGWPIAVLTELIAREPGIGELRLLVPLLRQLTREGRIVILLAPPHIPYAPALAGFGIDLDYVIVVQAPHAADRLWAVEQTLKSASFGALLAWLPAERSRPEHLRRMQLAALGARGPVFLFRTLAAQFESSPAPLRLLLLPRPNQQVSVQILKRRGPVLAMPMMLDLPQPPAAVTLRHSPARPDAEPPHRSLLTVHARQAATGTPTGEAGPGRLHRTH